MRCFRPWNFVQMALGFAVLSVTGIYVAATIVYFVGETVEHFTR